MKLRFFALAAVTLLLMAVPVSAITADVVITFNADAPGTNLPTGEGWVMTQSGSRGGSFGVDALVIDSGNSYKIDLIGGSGTNSRTISLLEPAPHTFVSYWMHYPGGGANGPQQRVYSDAGIIGGQEYNVAGGLMGFDRYDIQDGFQFSNTIQCGTTKIRFEMNINWAAGTTQNRYYRADGSLCYTHNDVLGPGMTKITGMNFGSQGDNTNYAPWYFDTFTFTGGVVVAPPSGLTAEVVKVGTASNTGKVVLKWNLSPDDEDQNEGALAYRIYRDGILVATDTTGAGDGGGSRTYEYLFTGAGPHGTADFTIRAFSDVDGESGDSCTATPDLDVKGDFVGCGDLVSISVVPVEFETGLIATLGDFGFISSESRMFFSLILIGSVQVVAGSASKMVAPGRMKNYLIMGSGAVVGVWLMAIGFMDAWMYLVAFMLGVFAIRGSKEARNTWLEVKMAIAQAQKTRFFTSDGEEVPAPVASAPDLSDPIADFNRQTDAIFEQLEATGSTETAVSGTSAADEDTDGQEDAE